MEWKPSGGTELWSSGGWLLGGRQLLALNSQLAWNNTFLFKFTGLYYFCFSNKSIKKYFPLLRWKSESVSHSVVSNSLQPHGLQPVRLFCLWDFPGKNTRVGCHAFLQGIFPTQGSKPGLLHCRWIFYHLSHQGCTRILEWLDYPFSRRTSWSRNQTGAPCIAGGLFTSRATQEAHCSS